MTQTLIDRPFESQIRDFHQNDEGIREYYLENGYVTIRDLVPESLINSLLKIYSTDIVTSRNKFIRQTTGRYEKNIVSNHGYVQQSFLDIHDYRLRHENFSVAARAIFGHPAIFDCLRCITGATSLSLMQTMFFDQNTGTAPHRDWWYLDSLPSGHLIAAWIALEDIHEEAGRFYLLPKTLDLPPMADCATTSPYTSSLQWIRKLVDEHKESIHVPVMRKGDVVFWNSRTVHGSYPTVNPRHSRKSLTAHYLPNTHAFGSLFSDSSHIQYKQIDGLRYQYNYQEYTMMNAAKLKLRRVLVKVPLLPKLIRAMRKKK
jgi:phytanoyl-CoA hydroxylase